MTLRIGNLELATPFILAPLEGVSDCAFRRLCFSLGAGFTWTEMVRASGIVRKNTATLDLIDTHDPETPTVVQLFAVNEHELLQALEALEQFSRTTHPHFRHIRAVDLNFGCPSPAIIRLGAGPAMLKRTAKMQTMLRTLHEWKSRTSLDIRAVGLKIRLGLNAQEAQYGIAVRVAEGVRDFADYLVVHARHARQKSTEPADWSAISAVRSHISIPLIGNGDALDADTARAMMEQTGCSGVLIARGAIRNPWIFRALRGAGSEMPSREEIERVIEQYRIDAHRFGAKPKYRTFHEENFRRMLQGSKSMNLPHTIHLS